MIPKECKRLAEVDFPLAVVSRAVVEKRSGHPRRLHHWWARRPLAACRGVLMAMLLPDPCDEQCPEEFKTRARRILSEVRQSPKTDEDLRRALLWFIGSFADWDASSDPIHLRVARELIRAAHPEETPLVVDPFAGGGSIPLEALRLGCDAFSSDLNPLPSLINTVLLEDVPRLGLQFLKEIKSAHAKIRARLHHEMVDLYPAEAGGALPLAYIWARVVRCEAPNCGAEIPLVRSFWLRNKPGSKLAIRYDVVKSDASPPSVVFSIFEPTADGDVPGPSVSDAIARCLCCARPLPQERVRAQLIAQRGGADVRLNATQQRTSGAQLLAVASTPAGGKGRQYRLASAADYTAVGRAMQRLDDLRGKVSLDGLSLIPDEAIVQHKVSRNSPFRMHLYGCKTFGDLFSARQKLALALLQDAIRTLDSQDAVKRFLCLSTGRCIRHWNAFSKWHRGSETVAGTFALQAISMAWDYPEMYPFAGFAGGIDDALASTVDVIEGLAPVMDHPGQVQTADAGEHPLPDASASCWFTDPPYYDAIPYSDLADVYYVWHKRTLPGEPALRSPFQPDNGLSPKDREMVQDDNRSVAGVPKNRKFFETVIGRAFKEGRRILTDDGIGCVVFAHSSTEGWEAFLDGLLQGGWVVTGSWPIATERGARLRARDSATLETSVHLICRPRPEDAPVGDWADVLHELPPRVAAWMERLQSEGIRGADLVFACIGPALEIFSRYRAVETAEGREVGLPEYLEKVWEVVGRVALKQVLGSGDITGSLEEDARLTALFLWTLQSTDVPEENGKKEKEDEDSTAKVVAKGFSLPFDVVRRFAQPMGIDLDVWTDRIIGQAKGVVRLLPVAERAKALFGEDGTRVAADWIESDTGGDLQGMLFPDMEPVTRKKTRGRGKKAVLSGDAEFRSPDATTLDRVHAAMLLQASGQANALRKLIGVEQDRGPDFLRLANALSALYPKGSEEKRLLAAMLLAVPR